ncbi:cytochrome c oxidase subunit II [Sneathiella sp. HT1-7]|jgi:cytochrome c oxidase subunit 2|uniref:cytochrome c oxidase subunit II n=1 Tax=Sneathiella sp. HT1-7 TaxID=2887192 RepID=UPI001D152142|nr:cytochrome c oxidase subunit II [Sneathiella sp. HT1-7]MCC3303424.1 cytochrome c oxidase subunit II [Sneathiella sp. HT1-7]
MGMVRNLVAFMAVIAGTVLTMGTAAAEQGQPAQWQTTFQQAFSPVAAEQHIFHNLLLWIISAITVFVLVLLLYVIVRFNKRANPNPSKTSHNTFIEIIWTVVPIMILIVIMIPSLKLLYYGDRIETPDMTLKAIGYQWYWGYEYMDEDGLAFEAVMLEKDELKPGQPRLLATDNAIVLPVETNIRVLVTAEDVLHSWAMPSFGVKMDAVPGRLNETWMRIENEGMYYGQCSELCGARHGFMPIMIKAVSKEDYAKWLVEAKKEFASDGTPAIKFAQITSTSAE